MGSCKSIEENANAANNGTTNENENYNNDNIDRMSEIEQFPREIHIRFASFLSLVDTIKFQNSSRHIKTHIRLNRLQQELPGDIINGFQENGDIANGDNIYLRETFNPFLESLIHSVKLSFYYKDQGWGNRKGHVLVTEKRNAEGEDIGRIVAKSPTAKHHGERCELVFKPKPGLSYGLCYQVGGGGCHQLFVIDITLESFVHLPPTML